MNDTCLEIRDASKSFKDKRVLTGVDLTLPRGSVLGLLGKNGAGKTTLIKCALGLLKIDGGEIRLLNEDPWNLSAAAKARLGYVPQVVNLYPWMKARHVIEYTGSFYPTWNSELVRSLVKRWGIDPEQQIGPMSVGEAQKVGIVLALGHEPELLILDEPAASLDPAARREFLAQVLDVVANGSRTVLFSTHITSDIERVADRVAILKDGRTLFDGGLDELKDTIKRLHVVSAAPLPSAFAVPGALAHQTRGNEALVAVRGVTPELIGELGQRWNAQVSVEDLNLEDIFLEMHHDQP